MDKGYSALINQVSDEKLEIYIQSKRSSTREFDIHISKDGLKITLDGRMSVKPRAANQIELDYE